ncbi:hypothetical protein FHETE_3263 [Fusarium heterosporum]|uniref:Uncharacterized protein n=1 Tax=Fusarium heterosporum TaxID=42747 RepID=A0A8H5WVQ9_FUSHE|nr:hypothetical protein FHETE_3263 [Fusarium heterosporum]
MYPALERTTRRGRLVDCVQFKISAAGHEIEHDLYLALGSCRPTKRTGADFPGCDDPNVRIRPGEDYYSFSRLCQLALGATRPRASSKGVYVAHITTLDQGQEKVIRDQVDFMRFVTELRNSITRMNDYQTTVLGLAIEESVQDRLANVTDNADIELAGKDSGLPLAQLSRDEAVADGFLPPEYHEKAQTSNSTPSPEDPPLAQLSRDEAVGIPRESPHQRRGTGHGGRSREPSRGRFRSESR